MLVVSALAAAPGSCPSPTLCSGQPPQHRPATGSPTHVTGRKTGSACFVQNRSSSPGRSGCGGRPGPDRAGPRRRRARAAGAVAFKKCTALAPGDARAAVAMSRGGPPAASTQRLRMDRRACVRARSTGCISDLRSWTGQIRPGPAKERRRAADAPAAFLLCRGGPGMGRRALACTSGSAPRAAGAGRRAPAGAPGGCSLGAAAGAPRRRPRCAPRRRAVAKTPPALSSRPGGARPPATRLAAGGARRRSGTTAASSRGDGLGWRGRAGDAGGVEARDRVGHNLGRPRSGDGALAGSKAQVDGERGLQGLGTGGPGRGGYAWAGHRVRKRGGAPWAGLSEHSARGRLRGWEAEPGHAKARALTSEPLTEPPLA